MSLEKYEQAQIGLLNTSFEQTYLPRIHGYTSTYVSCMNTIDRIGGVFNAIFRLPDFKREEVEQHGFGMITDLHVNEIVGLLREGRRPRKGVIPEWEEMNDEEKAQFARWGSATSIIALRVCISQSKRERVKKQIPVVARRLFLSTVRISEEFDQRRLDPEHIASIATALLHNEEGVANRVSDLGERPFFV